MPSDDDKILVAVVVGIEECGSPPDDGLAESHQSGRSCPEGKVLLALIQVEFAVFVLVVGDQNIGFQVSIEIRYCESHATIDDGTGAEAGA